MFHKISQIIKFLSSTHVILSIHMMTDHNMSDFVLQSMYKKIVIMKSFQECEEMIISYILVIFI